MDLVNKIIKNYRLILKLSAVTYYKIIEKIKLNTAFIGTHIKIGNKII